MIRRIVFAIAALLLLSASAPALAQEESEAPGLRIGFQQTMDRLPLLIAEQAGYFAEAGIAVEQLAFSGGSDDIQAALLAGELDGALVDIVFALENRQRGGDLRVLREVGIGNSTRFAFVAGAGSPLKSSAELAGLRLGVTPDAQYQADALLISAGIDPDTVEYVLSPGYLVLFEQTVLREVDAGLLTEPYVEASRGYGADVLLDDAALSYPEQAIGFRAQALNEKGEAVRAFLQAYERAVAAINAMRGDAAAYREFSSTAGGQRGGQRRSTMETMILTGQLRLPTFAPASAPAEADFAALQDWALANGVVAAPLAYAEVVDDRFLPAEKAPAAAGVGAADADAAASDAATDAPAPDLRIGYLTVLNALPLNIAQDAGYFADEGLTVELKLFLSAKDLTGAVLAGELDGLQADLVSALRMNAGGGDMRVVRHVGITNQPFVTLLASPQSGIQSVAELAGARIGLSHNTIIQYMTDSLLAGVGMSAADVEYVEVSKILARYNDLLRGEIDAASLPEPFASLTLRYGARPLVDDSVMAYVPEALSLRAEALAAKGDMARAFLRAYERAVATLNGLENDTAGYLAFGEAIAMKPDTVVKSMVAGGILPVPGLTLASVPDAAEYAAVHDWALANGLLSEAQAYEEVIDGRYLPETMAKEEMTNDGDASDGDMAEESDGDDE